MRLQLLSLSTFLVSILMATPSPGRADRVMGVTGGPVGSSALNTGTSTNSTLGTTGTTNGLNTANSGLNTNGLSTSNPSDLTVPAPAQPMTPPGAMPPPPGTTANNAFGTTPTSPATPGITTNQQSGIAAGVVPQNPNISGGYSINPGALGQTTTAPPTLAAPSFPGTPQIQPTP